MSGRVFVCKSFLCIHLWKTGPNSWLALFHLLCTLQEESDDTQHRQPILTEPRECGGILHTSRGWGGADGLWACQSPDSRSGPEPGWHPCTHLGGAGPAGWGQSDSQLKANKGPVFHSWLKHYRNETRITSVNLCEPGQTGTTNIDKNLRP